MAADRPTDIRVELIDDAPSPPPQPPFQRWRSETTTSRRAGRAAAVAAVAVAGLVGVAVGRASTGGGSEADVESTPEPFGVETATVRPSTPTSVETIAAGEGAIAGATESSAPIADHSASTVGRPIVAAGEAGGPGRDAIVVSGVALDSRVRGIDLSVVAPRRDGTWARLDLGEGCLSEIVDVDPTSFLTDQPVVAGSGWLAYSPRDDPETTALWSDATGAWETLPIPASPRHLRETDTASFWVEDTVPATGATRTFELWDVADGTTGERIEIPAGARVEGSDPAGGLIVRVGGRWVRVTPEDRTVLGTGVLLAVNEIVVATWSCDDALVCGIAVTDREAGATKVLLDGDRPVGLPADPDERGASDLGSALSADGRRLAVNSFSPNGFELAVVDLTTGSYQRVAEHSRPLSTVWTPDGRFLLHTNLGVLHAFDVRAGESFRVAPNGQLNDWNTVAVVR